LVFIANINIEVVKFLAEDMQIALKSISSHFSPFMLKMFPFRCLVNCNPNCINTYLTCIFRKQKLIPR
jgi:hypothetical protein